MNTNEQSDNSEKNSDTILNALEGTEEILFELSNSQRLMIMFKLKELTKSAAAAAATEVKDNNQKVNVYSQDFPRNWVWLCKRFIEMLAD